MSFFIGMIVNAALLSIPIGASLGTMIAIKPFRDDIVPIATLNDAIIQMTYCDATHTFHAFAENKNGVNFTINSNEILQEPDSVLCMTITENENATYTSNSTVPEFSITWEYPFTVANASVPLNESKPLIHAFPQATLQDAALPLPIIDLGQLVLDFVWTMGIGDANSPSTSELRLDAQQVNSSVALDMYMDADKTKASEGGEAAFEMIIFFANFGLQDPVGFGNASIFNDRPSIVTTTKLDGVSYDLYVGQNAALQNVFSWVAETPVTTFSGDIGPLFNIILNLSTMPGFASLGVNIPSFNDYLGYVGFGTQAFNSEGHVTFFVPNLNIDLRPFGGAVTIGK